MIEQALESRELAIGPRRVWPYALLLFGIFFIAEPLEPNFSVSDTFNFVDSEETTLERIEGNVEAHREGRLGRKVGMLLLGGVGMVLLLRPGGARLQLNGPLAWLIVVFLAWALLSVIWSHTPGITLRRLIVLFSLAGAAAGFAKHFTLAELTRLALYSTGLVASGGFACELLYGGFRPWEQGWRFAGFTWPAFTCWNLSLFVMALLVQRRETPIRWSHAALAIAWALVFLTKTRAGAGALIVAMMLYGAALWPFAAQAAAVVLGSFVVGSGLLYAAFSGADLYEMVIGTVNLGREESVGDISGRAGVWQALVPYILARPLHGYGYESFWTAEHLVAIGEDNWGAPDAHNGYINLALGVGVIGSLLYAAILCVGLYRCYCQYRAGRQRAYIFAASVLVITLINALCVATQLGPYLMSFISLLVLARLALVEVDDGPPTPLRVSDSAATIDTAPMESCTEPSTETAPV